MSQEEREGEEEPGLAQQLFRKESRAYIRSRQVWVHMLSWTDCCHLLAGVQSVHAWGFQRGMVALKMEGGTSFACSFRSLSPRMLYKKITSCNLINSFRGSGIAVLESEVSSLQKVI